MTMSYDLFNSGLKRLKTPCIILLFILWFFAYHVKFCFLRFRNINELFNTEGRYCTHTLRSIYFSKWFSHWQVISGLQMCLYFCFKTPLSKIYFYSFFFTQNHWSSLCSIPQFSDSRSLWHTLVEISGKLSGYWCSNPRFIKSF